MIPKRTIKVYPNNKFYITKEVKECINRKKEAFKTNDQKQLNQRLKEAREAIEGNLQIMNPKKLWDVINETAINMKPTKKAKANELSGFYRQFDNYDFSAECDIVLNGIAIDDVDRLEIYPKSVNKKVLKQINVNKATGPDGIMCRLIETCLVPHCPEVPRFSHCTNTMEKGNHHTCA